MKIIFNPYYDAECYLDFVRRGDVILNEIFVGPLGLLNELELRGGLFQTRETNIERKADYLMSVYRYMNDHPRSMFSESFKVDDFGVASELLRWRDALRRVGWNAADSYGLKKLEELVLIEQTFESVGESDRWYALLEATVNDTVLPSDYEIEVHATQDLIEPLYVQLFDNIQQKGVKISYLPQLASERSKDCAAKVLRFSLLSDAYEWAASLKWGEGDVVVNRDNKALNNILFSFDKPMVNSSVNHSNPQIIQLFKLAFSLFIKPLNIYNLLSFLQIPTNPIPTHLRSQLINTIIDNGGLGRQWREIIDTFSFTDREGNPNKAEETRVRQFLSIVDKKHEQIDKTMLQKFNDTLSSWASSRRLFLETSQDAIEQLGTLKSFCDALRIVLNNCNQEVISYKQLEQWIFSIYEPSHFTHETAQEGSMNVVTTTAAIIDCPQRIIWLDCVSEDNNYYPFDFLNHQESEALKTSGLLIPDKLQSIRAKLLLQKEGLYKAEKEVIFVISESDKGKRLAEHPLFSAEKERGIKEIATPSYGVAQEDVIQTHLPSPKLGYQLQNVTIQPRSTESYSSLEKLIQHPFDYTIEYLAGLRDSSVQELQETDRIKGNIAHRIVESLANNINLTADEENVLIEKAVDEVGMIMRLDENRIDLDNFRLTIKDSICHLREILKENELSIEGCEVVVEGSFDPLHLESRLDLLLKGTGGDYVILDMKWSRSHSYYWNKIEDNRALQLEVYHKLTEASIPDARVKAAGFFMLKDGLLYTDSQVISGSYVRNIAKKNTGDIFKQAYNSYDYRYEQLGRGFIECAEDADLGDIDYAKETAVCNLYPLEVDKKTGKKRRNTFGNTSLFKGELN